MYILQNTFRIIRWANSQVILHSSIPCLRQVLDFQLAFPDQKTEKIAQCSQVPGNRTACEARAIEGVEIPGDSLGRSPRPRPDGSVVQVAEGRIESEFVRIEVDGPVGTLVFNRPEVLNAIRYETMINRSLLETLHRSLATQLNSQFVMLAIILFGGATIRQFMVIMLIGMFTGTYSSLFFAVPLLVVWERNEWSRIFKRRSQPSMA